ncbi:MAG: Ig-like domain-containing protein, partial [candidate division WOR-3 bacterium]|nr:Ig-like domain-containing protein [candidate division WOR-3 bacterium]
MIKRITIISVMTLGLVFLAGCGLLGDTEDPTVSITQPADNAVVSGTVEIKATADDNEGVTKVEFYVDGDLEGTDNEAADFEYSYSWDASGETPGSSHTIQAKAYDAADNVGESSVITVTIAGGGGPT